MNETMTEAVMAAAIPLMAAGTGALMSEYAGVLNIALEGFMSLGAFSMFTFLAGGMPFGTALVLSLLVCTLGGLILALLSGPGRADPFMTGMGLNLLLPGIIPLVSRQIHGPAPVLALPDPASASWPVIAVFFTTMLLMSGYHIYTRRTRPGIRSTVAGSDPDMLEARGISPGRHRFAAMVLSSLLAGMGGAFLLADTGSWVPGMSAGRGWIALILVYAGGRNAPGVLLAALAYAATDTAGLRFQHWFPVPGLQAILPSLGLLALAMILQAFRRYREKTIPYRAA